MMIKRLIYLTIALFIVAGLATSLHAQKWEIHPYAGAFNPRQSDFGEFKSDGIYGLKGSVDLNPAFELEGNVGYINHFELRNTDPTSRGLLYEAAGNFQIPMGRFKPYLTGGVGGLTAMIDRDVLDFGDNSPGSANMLGHRLDDGDTFFMFSYGGGVKAERLWGPVGLRGEVRGRTLPNIFGDSATWVETTGGITFSWGE